jgi:hypothetical protein
MNDSPARQFKGVWIPAELWLDKNLTWTEKCLIAEIESLSTKDKPCFATNEYLGKMFNVSERTIHNMLTELRKKGWIKNVVVDECKRGLIVVFPACTDSVQRGCMEKVQGGCTQTDSAEQSPIISRDTRIDTTIEGLSQKRRFDEMKKRISQHYHRAPDAPWPYSEEYALSVISRRPTCLQEMNELFEYSKRAEGYFPKSVSSLLENWDKNLDKARDQQGPHMSLSDLKTQKETIGELIDKHPGNHKSVTYNPDSKEIVHLKADLANLRKQYAGINTQILNYGRPTATA